MNKVINQYISNVKKGLYNLVPSDNYLFDLRETLEEYIHQFPNSTYQDLTEQFGTPEDVADEYISCQKKDIPKELAKHRKNFRLFIILAISIIIFLICFVASLSQGRQAYYTDTITETEGEVISE